ncbi:MAG: tetratricopeptide repeat protein [Nitrosomonadales bacterium]|nr:MAG: tetratricopeptide repeat protein [Nitrosomonadales bacterium]
METRNHLEMGNTCFNEGRLTEADKYYTLVLASDPDQPDALHGLGMVAWMQGNLERAMDMVGQAISQTPDSVFYLNSMGEILRSRGEFEEAKQTLLRALGIAPEFAQARNNLGMIYMTQGDFQKSVTEFRQAVQLAPDLAMAYFNLGLASKELNQLDEAISAYRQAIVLNPDFVMAHVNLAIALLLDGQLREGFEEYEWRLRPEFAPTRQFDRPRWDGLIDPKGTLLVHTEQGYGDTIQFIRYLPFIAAEGMRIIVQCPAELQNLLQSVEGVSMAYTFDEVLPDFDAHIPLLSMPFLFQTDLSKIPANVPYLSAPFEKVQSWREWLYAQGETIKIGLRWAGNPHNTQDEERSFPLSVFEPLAGLPQVMFVSLQNTPLTDAEKISAGKLGLVDVSADLHDFVDTVALIENLNLVISVDTAVLHLAGALGKQVWGLQKYAPHWPWMLERDTSPWYPSMRLFRQQQRGDWVAVSERVAGMLRDVMQSIKE